MQLGSFDVKECKRCICIYNNIYIYIQEDGDDDDVDVDFIAQVAAIFQWSHCRNQLAQVMRSSSGGTKNLGSDQQGLWSVASSAFGSSVPRR